MRLPRSGIAIRAVLFVLALLTLATLVAVAQPTWGPEDHGQAKKHAPVLQGAIVQPSPNASPIPAGKVVQLAANQYGHLMVQALGNVTLQSGTQAINVTLPAASPVPVLQGSTTTAGSSLTTTVNTTNTTIFTSNSSRKGWLLTNNGSFNAYVTFGSTAVSGATATANGGHLLQANGGQLGMEMTGGYNGAITLITASGNTTIASSDW